MKQIILVALLSLVWACNSKQGTEVKESKDSVAAQTNEPSGDKDSTSAGFDLMKEENFGGLSIGLSSDEVIKLLGEAESKTAVTVSEVDGMNGQTWMYPSKGLEVSFSEDENKKWSVISYLLKEDATLKSTRGIGIGSSKDEVMKAYQKEIGEQADEGSIVAGTVYGGIVFWLGEGKVRNIFVGASAD